MSEPIRMSAAKRDKLAAALKRNMARRKGVARATRAAAGEPRAMPLVEGQHSTGDSKPPSSRGDA